MSESVAGWALVLAAIVFAAIAATFLRHPLVIKKVFLRLLHAMYGERLPVVIWKPFQGGVAFAVCAILAPLIGILKILGVTHLGV
jgi:hypothetical protein